MLRLVRSTHAAIPAQRRRPAFTLLELTLVLALAVILVALAWPSLERPLSTHRLRIAADTVRGLWTSTRVDAMDSGEVLMFRYAPGSNRYRIERQQADDGSSSTTSGSGSSGSGASAGTTNGGDPLPSRVARLPREATLPEGISFASSDVTATDQQTDPTQQLPSTIDGTTKTDNNWSQPILFYIDGTCSNARLVLKNDRDFSIEIALRGLTGVTTVSEVSKGEPAGKKG
jgi:Tfp pilus assembly protein FimT